MSHRYVEVKSHRRRVPKMLDHVSIHGNENADGHVVVSHYDDGTEERAEFRHPEQGKEAQSHLGQLMKVRNPGEFEPGSLEVAGDDVDKGEKV